jgi:cytochrome c6
MTSLFNISLKEKNVNGKSIVGGAVVVVLAGAFSLSAGQDAAKAPAGAAIFAKKCVLCHGADGTGNTPLGKQLQAANLHSKDVQKQPDAELHRIIHDGQTNMPPFGDQLTDDEIDQVIQYVRTFAGPVKKH